MASPHLATRRNVCHCGAIGDVSSRLGSVVLHETSIPLAAINTTSVTIRCHREQKEGFTLMTAFQRIGAADVKIGHTVESSRDASPPNQPQSPASSAPSPLCGESSNHHESQSTQQNDTDDNFTPRPTLTRSHIGWQ
jgi:hypothetical protein